jgi:UDP-MurNAc hydroxylase
MDYRLLKRIVNRQAHWNNAEIGCHVDFIRTPNTYLPDVHTMLSFFCLPNPGQ